MNKRLFLKITTLGCEKHQHLDQKKKIQKSLDTDEERIRIGRGAEGHRLRAGAEAGAQGRLQKLTWDELCPEQIK